MIRADNRGMAFEFFKAKLDFTWMDDFQGVMFIPDEFRSRPAEMSHVAVAIAWHGFTGRTCMLSAVIQDPALLSRRIVRETFEYPFLVRGCEAVLATVDSLNEKSLEICRRLGFKVVHRIPDGGPDADMIVFQMLKADCRWLKKVH